MGEIIKCPNCGNDNIVEFVIEQVMVHLSKSELTLGCCRNCGIIFCIDFAEKYLVEKGLENGK